MSDIKTLKRALTIYKICRRFPSLKRFFRTELGFCNYFSTRHKSIPTSLCKEAVKRNIYGGFWYPEGHLEPRIALLVYVIKKLKTS